MRAREWGPVLAAMGVGVLLGTWWARRARPGADIDFDDGWVDRWGDRVDSAVEAATVRWKRMERRLRAPAPVSDRRLAEALADLHGASGLEARALAPGVVDLSGEAGDEAAAAARASLQDLPGVEVVLDRVWTPSSAAPGSN